MAGVDLRRQMERQLGEEGGGYVPGQQRNGLCFVFLGVTSPLKHSTTVYKPTSLTTLERDLDFNFVFFVWEKLKKNIYVMNQWPGG